jgi:phage nucleotide-binding protein
MQIKKTGQTDQKLKCLVYAASGAGKTTLAGTLEGRTLIISAESGLLSLSSKGIDYVDIDGSNANEKVKSIYAIYGELEKGMEYDNIFVDSITEIAQIFVEFQNGIFKDRKDAMVLWGEYAKMIRGFVKKFRDLKQYNVIFTALEKVEKDEIGRRFKVPDLSGSIATQMPQFFDEVFTIRISDDGKRMIQTDGREGYLCKDRSSKLNAFENTNLGEIFTKINGG